MQKSAEINIFDVSSVESEIWKRNGKETRERKCNIKVMNAVLWAIGDMHVVDATTDNDEMRALI